MTHYPPPAPMLFKVKDGMLANWLAWCEKLQTELHDEAQNTLRHEGLLYEYFVNFAIDGVHYTLGAGITSQGQAPLHADTSQTINQEHRRIMKECLEPVVKGEYAYFIDATDFPSTVLGK